MAIAPKHDDEYEISAVTRTFDALELIVTEGSVRLTDLARRLGVAKTTAFRYLWNLEQRGYVATLSDGAYGPGPNLMRLGQQAGEPWQALLEITRADRVSLRDELKETVNLGVLYDGRVLFLEVLSSKHALRMVPDPGTGGYLHATALGKSLLACFPNENATSLVDRFGLPSLTTKTITDQDRLLAELDITRQRGWAFDDEESLDGLRCLAVALTTANGPLGAISIEAPISRMPDDVVEVYAKRLLDFAVDLRPVLKRLRHPAS